MQNCPSVCDKFNDMKAQSLKEKAERQLERKQKYSTQAARQTITENKLDTVTNEVKGLTTEISNGLFYRRPIYQARKETN